MPLPLDLCPARAKNSTDLQIVDVFYEFPNSSLGPSPSATCLGTYPVTQRLSEFGKADVKVHLEGPISRVDKPDKSVLRFLREAEDFPVFTRPRKYFQYQNFHNPRTPYLLRRRVDGPRGTLHLLGPLL